MAPPALTSSTAATIQAHLGRQQRVAPAQGPLHHDGHHPDEPERQPQGSDADEELLVQAVQRATTARQREEGNTFYIDKPPTERDSFHLSLYPGDSYGYVQTPSLQIPPHMVTVNIDQVYKRIAYESIIGTARAALRRIIFRVR